MDSAKLKTWKAFIEADELQFAQTTLLATIDSEWDDDEKALYNNCLRDSVGLGTMGIL